MKSSRRWWSARTTSPPELLCGHLVADRYEALPAPSASDALRLCHYKQPDLMLLDLMLPDAPGLDVLREVRAADGATSKFDPELPVIVLSGRCSEHSSTRAAPSSTWRARQGTRRR